LVLANRKNEQDRYAGLEGEHDLSFAAENKSRELVPLLFDHKNAELNPEKLFLDHVPIVPKKIETYSSNRAIVHIFI
jgi:hypothetical protein